MSVYQILPRYLHLDLSKHVMRNVIRLRLRAHTLKNEAAARLEEGSRACDHCPGEDEHVQNEVHALSFCQDQRGCELRKHISFWFITPLFEDFSAQPSLLQQVNNKLVHISFFSRTPDIFSFFRSLWIYLWLAETSQQPISQTTCLKVSPHCNHCNHWKAALVESLPFQHADVHQLKFLLKIWWLDIPSTAHNTIRRCHPYGVARTITSLKCSV